MRIERRSFIKMMSLAALLPYREILASDKSNSLKIKTIEIWRLEGTRPPSEGFIGWIQANPAKVYDQTISAPVKRTTTEKSLEKQTALYLKIMTDCGLEGIYGPIDLEVADVINSQLKPRLVNLNPIRGEYIWDQLYRTFRHSRAGYYMMAISAIDNALWDLRGKFFNVPVYELLGGPTRSEVPVYASCLGFSVDPEMVSNRCITIANQGFKHQKWFFSYGPGQGRKGLEYNILLVKSLRDTLGFSADIMVDVFMGWDLDYAISWAKSVEHYQPRWLEEAFQPTEIQSFKTLRDKTSIPIASGEHLYNRWEVLEYLKYDALSVVQTDPEWCGGVSELVKICSFASGYNAMVIPHGHNLHAALHVIASQSPDICPMGEYLINKMDYNYMFEKFALIPKEGKIKLNDNAGFGIEFDENTIQKQEQLFV